MEPSPKEEEIKYIEFVPARKWNTDECAFISQDRTTYLILERRNTLISYVKCISHGGYLYTRDAKGLDNDAAWQEAAQQAVEVLCQETLNG